MNFERDSTRPKVSEKRAGWQNKCITKFHEGLFPHLTDAGVNRLREMIMPVRYPEGDLLFQEDGLSDGIYLVCRGFVVYGKGNKDHPNGSRIFKLLGAGKIVGEETLFARDNRARFGFARCLVDTDLLFLEKDEFLAFLRGNPEAYQDFCAYLSSILKGVEERLFDEGPPTAKRRLACLLMKIERQMRGYGSDAPLPLHLKRKVLAGILGVSESSITRLLRGLDENRLLSTEEDLCIESLDALEGLARGQG
ncbi:MAG: Crp/Fnr family transcriptional regulator [Candidatus Acetothermia bacterium]